MKSLFRAFEKYGVRYLLISGQACVLYGASRFTEDIDFWIHPKQQNFQAFLRAMAHLRATVYKLTPPITQAYIRKGHGFYFKVESERRARKISTEWGMLTVEELHVQESDLAWSALNLYSEGADFADYMIGVSNEIQDVETTFTLDHEAARCPLFRLLRI